MSQLIFNPFTNKLDFVDNTIVPPGTVATITGDTGGPIDPSAGTINIQGDQAGHLGAISFAGTNPGQIYATVLVDGVTIAINGSGQLTVLSSGNSYEDKDTSFLAESNVGYFCTPGAGITATLPASPNLGDLVSFISDGPNLTVQANTGQFLNMATATSASAGTALNTLKGDSIDFRYRASNSTWYAESFNGSWTVT